MKRWIVALISLLLILTSCARVKNLTTAATESLPKPAPKTDINAVAQTQESHLEINFESMTFLQKNNLYLQLLDEQQPQGVDTIQAEDCINLP